MTHHLVEALKSRITVLQQCVLAPVRPGLGGDEPVRPGLDGDDPVRLGLDGDEPVRSDFV